MPPADALPEVSYTLNIGGDTSWEVVRVHFTEGLSELYDCTIEAASEAPESDPGALLGVRATLTIARDSEERFASGVVASVIDRGWIARRRVVEVSIVPTLWLLGQRVGFRVWQERSALEVVSDVLDGANAYMTAQQGRTVEGAAKATPRDYCTQYGESDLAFVRRLLEEEGFAFHFNHSSEGDALAITAAGTNDSFVKLAAGETFLLMGEGGATHERETVRSLDEERRVASTQILLRDTVYETWPLAKDQDRGAADGRPVREREVYEFPARFALKPASTQSDAARLAGVRMEQLRGTDKVYFGRSNITRLTPGRVISLQREDNGDIEDFLVLRVVHTGECPEVLYLDEGNARDQNDRYSNAFECVAIDDPWQPPRVTQRPRAMAPQLAVVLDSAGETSRPAMQVDKLGRIKVRFVWMRHPAPADHVHPSTNTAWVRVVQPWTGQGEGFHFIPRPETEVLVQYVDGDPDQPLITGGLYNAHQPPYLKMPDKKFRSAIRTARADDVSHYNELAFEDEVGAEEISVRAERDLIEKVLNDHLATYDRDETVTVGRDQKTTVTRDRTEEVTRNETVTVHGARSVTIDKNDALEVSGKLDVTCFDASTLTVSKTHTISIDEGLKVVVGGNAGTSLQMTPSKITLKTSGATLELGPAEIKLTVAGTSLALSPAELKAVGTGMASLATSAGGKVDIAGPMVTVQSPAIVTVQGSLVKIN